MPHETHRDAILDSLSERIDIIKGQLANVQAEIEQYEETKEAVHYDISFHKSERDEAKAEADRLFEYARDCPREYKDTAETYRADAMTLMEQVRDIKEQLADSYDELDSVKWELKDLNEKRGALRAELNSLIRQHKDRIRQLKEQDALNWREKPCTVCGRPLRYNTTWKHIPNICSECKKEFQAKLNQKK